MDATTNSGIPGGLSGPPVEQIFNQKLDELLNTSSNKAYSSFTKEQYFNLIEEIKQASAKPNTKSNREYYILARFKIIIYF